MKTPKEALIELVPTLPDDVSYEDIMYRLYVRAKLDRAMKDIEEGRLFDQEEVEGMIAQWREE